MPLQVTVPEYPLERIRLVPARYDNVVDAENVEELVSAWGLEDVRWLPGGHVTSALFFRRMFAEPLLLDCNRNCIFF